MIPWHNPTIPPGGAPTQSWNYLYVYLYILLRNGGALKVDHHHAPCLLAPQRVRLSHVVVHYPHAVQAAHRPLELPLKLPPLPKRVPPRERNIMWTMRTRCS